MNTKFRVKEFAEFSGVTVRTLQYYDRMGLLKPSSYTNANHRIYRIDDLLRLQQILTFKYLGYGLVEIRKLMAAPAFDVGEALKAQGKAIGDRIAQLQKVATSIDRTVAALDSIKTQDLDWNLVLEIIAGIIASERWDWVQDYYTPQQNQLLKRRSHDVTPQQLAKWQREWSEVMLGFQQLMSRKRKPGEAEAQLLAKKMSELVEGFTQGDKGIERSLGRAYSNLDKVPKGKRPHSTELQTFMSEACAIYRKEKT
jgi:MerR family transcriptional regulator, thiopeptide resistance regulator